MGVCPRGEGLAEALWHCVGDRGAFDEAGIVLLRGGPHVSQDDAVRHRLTVTAEIASIVSVVIGFFALRQEGSRPGNQRTGALPDTSPTPTASPSSTPLPAPRRITGNALEAVNSTAHGFGTAWSGQALVLWAIPLLVLIGSECARNADSSRAMLVPLFSLILWLWIFWPSLSGLGVVLVIIGAVLAWWIGLFASLTSS